MAEERQNLMKTIKIAEIVLSCGALDEKLERAFKLLKVITGKEPIKTLARKRIPTFGIRPGLPVGCKVTLKGKDAEQLLKRFLEAIGNKLAEKQIGNGQLSFGIHEYIEIPGMQFHREIGIMGFDISVNLIRAGSKIAERKSKKGHVPLRHRISKQETIMFMQEKFNTQIVEKRREK
jgi:large subunit ribosomal protein L5